MKTINDFMSKTLQEEFCTQKSYDHLTLVFNVLTMQYEVYAWYQTTVASFDMWAATSYSLVDMLHWIEEEMLKEAKLANVDTFYGV